MCCKWFSLFPLHMSNCNIKKKKKAAELRLTLEYLSNWVFIFSFSVSLFAKRG